MTELSGVDGVAQEIPDVNFCQHDYTQGPLDLTEENYDLCWSCEFVEHVSEQYIPNFLLSFASADLILMTHAEPGQPGHHHVNLQPAAYWKGAMAAIGYRLNEGLTFLTRELASESEVENNHYVRSGLVFER